ncbi:hypothetical protein POSPLADRAFT_1072508 [Postia placenta MAD-698-R-SB12]|uniref:Uncharacterized protein n=1 Tax=Postia placenta MAD-698-R-SB12 TaxID=670580 RepID=A0A1X6NGG0_9APHY|nr:hypothetical protein POSPLADRAFT_1072508 [Postia placenta MAD-698-R-SB12]OSX67709.1 hypothetical protein POSPLADRAFT_1072508 [Postia placenta MAD-698-R-SB12]
MPFRYDLSFVLLCIISFVVRFAAAGVLRNYTIGLADPFVTFSTGWNTATYAKGEYVFADRLGDRVLALLPANTVAVHYVGLKQDAGALYAACLNCHTADGSRFMLVDASERCEEPTTAILFSFSGLDPTQLHSLEVVNLEDPIFGFTSQITFGSFIVTVLQDDVVPTRQGQVGWLPAGLPSDGSVSKSLASTATAIITRRPSDTSASFTSTLRSSVVITTVSGSEPSHGDPLGTSTQTSPARGSLTSVLTSLGPYLNDDYVFHAIGSAFVLCCMELRDAVHLVDLAGEHSRLYLYKFRVGTTYVPSFKRKRDFS